MKLLITSDIHLTDNDRDSYRFGLFPWLRDQQIRYQSDAVLILGDLTDAKDRHSAKLVNSLVDGLKLLRPPVHILKGNHDFIDLNNPFFGFLPSIPGLHFYIDPFYIKKLNVYMIPHQPDQISLNNAFRQAPDGALICLHQTITGAVSETGERLTGLTVPPNKAKAIYSGDIHLPQRIKINDTQDIVYVGAPTHIHFGDSYQPRVLLLDVG